jgi:hypothetical protein
MVLGEPARPAADLVEAGKRASVVAFEALEDEDGGRGSEAVSTPLLGVWHDCALRLGGGRPVDGGALVDRCRVESPHGLDGRNPF